MPAGGGVLPVGQSRATKDDDTDERLSGRSTLFALRCFDRCRSDMAPCPHIHGASPPPPHLLARTAMAPPNSHARLPPPLVAPRCPPSRRPPEVSVVYASKLPCLPSTAAKYSAMTLLTRSSLSFNQDLLEA